MLSMNRRETEKQQLRRQILDAAGELFVREGYENVSMRKIASRIGYSPTTIYLYFQDKEALFASLCEETFAGLIENLQGLSKNGADPLGALRMGLRAYIDFGLAHPNHYAVTFLTPLTGHEGKPGPSLGPAAFDTLRHAVTHCIAAGKFPGADVEMTSQLLWSAIHGVTALLITTPRFPWVDRDELIDKLIDTQIRGLVAGVSTNAQAASKRREKAKPRKQSK
jgi:AcrR family transcriptional regulator